MKRFWKEVIRPDKYHHRDRVTKQDTVTEVTADHVEHWNKTAQAMFSKGLTIPVPYAHDASAVPEAPSADPRDLAARIVDSRVNEAGELECLFDPCSEEDEKRFNAQVKEVSIFTDDWKDGKGNQYKDAITHVAACIHPVMGNQKPFEPESGLALSLSMASAPEPKGKGKTEQPASLELGIRLLRERGIELGEDTTPDNFMDRLCTVLQALAHADKEDGDEDLETMPTGAKVQRPAPIAMSSLLEFSLDKVKQSPTNPATNKEWTSQELEAAYEAHKASQPKLSLSAEDQAAFDLVQKNNKLGLLGRIDKCMKQGTMDSSVAKDLAQHIQGERLQFSADGRIDEAKHPAIFLPLRQAESASPGQSLTGKSTDEVDEMVKKLGLSIEERPNFGDAVDPPSKEDLERIASHI